MILQRIIWSLGSLQTGLSRRSPFPSFYSFYHLQSCLFSLKFFICPPSNSCLHHPSTHSSQTSPFSLPQLPTVTETLSLLPSLETLKGLREPWQQLPKAKKEKKTDCKQTGYFIHSDELWKHSDNQLTFPQSLT